MKLKKLLSEENVVRSSILSKYVDECLDKIANESGLGHDYDAIKLSESIIDYLQRKHIRYKN